MTSTCNYDVNKLQIENILIVGAKMGKKRENFETKHTSGGKLLGSDK